MPFASHSIFSDFFKDRDFSSELDRSFFKPLLLDRSSLHNKMDIESLGPDTEYAETFKKSSVQRKGEKGITEKTVTEKTELKNGKKVYIKTEEVVNEDGTKQITQTIRDDQGTKTNSYNLAIGQ